MFVANIAVHTLSHMTTTAIWLFQDQGAVGFDPISLWKQMGILAKIVVVILFIMSGWSIGVMIDRAMAFNAARKQSRARSAMARSMKPSKLPSAIRRAIWPRLSPPA